MASKKKTLTQKQHLDRATAAVSTILMNLDVKGSVEKYMRARARITERAELADFLKLTQVDAEDIMLQDEMEFKEDFKVLVDVILGEIETYSKL